MRTIVSGVETSSGCDLRNVFMRISFQDLTAMVLTTPTSLLPSCAGRARGAPVYSLVIRDPGAVRSARRWLARRPGCRPVGCGARRVAWPAIVAGHERRPDPPRLPRLHRA